MKKILTCMLAYLCVGVVSATTITFNEGLAPTGTQLEGTNFYDPYGVSFESSILFGFDPNLPDDGWGITNSPSSIGVINFFSEVDSIDITWATASDNIDYNATAFDSLNNIVDSFFFDSSLSDDTFGTASLSGSGIVRLEYNDSGGSVAVDTLSFTSNAPSVPGPGILLLLSLGFAGIAFSRKMSPL